MSHNGGILVIMVIEWPVGYLWPHADIFLSLWSFFTSPSGKKITFSKIEKSFPHGFILPMCTRYYNH